MDMLINGKDETTGHILPTSTSIISHLTINSFRNPVPYDFLFSTFTTAHASRVWSLDLECRSPCVVSLGKLRQNEKILWRLSWKTAEGGRPYRFRLTYSLKNQSCSVVKGSSQVPGWVVQTPFQTISPGLAPLLTYALYNWVAKPGF